MDIKISSVQIICKKKMYLFNFQIKYRLYMVMLALEKQLY